MAKLYVILIVCYLSNFVAKANYIRKLEYQRRIRKRSVIPERSNEDVRPRALGNALTDFGSELQQAYDHWISNEGGAGHLAQSIPAKFSTAEHLIYDDYQIIGPHFRCPVDKPAWMCIFYLIDAYKARKFYKIPATVRYAIGKGIRSLKVMKGVLFPRHFVVQDAVDAISELGRRLGFGQIIPREGK